MSQRYADLVERLRQAVLEGNTATSAEVRRAAESRAAASAGRSARERELAPELVGFVDKVARRAHSITQDDVDALRRAGYSEDAIFEVITAAAIGAGLGRLERGLAALSGEI